MQLSFSYMSSQVAEDLFANTVPGLAWLGLYKPYYKNGLSNINITSTCTYMHIQVYVCIHTLIKTNTLSKRFLFLIGMFYVNSQGENVSQVEFFRKSFSSDLLVKILNEDLTYHPQFHRRVFFFSTGRSNLCRAKQEADPLSLPLRQYVNKQSVKLICLQIILTVWGLSTNCQLNSFFSFSWKL